MSAAARPRLAEVVHRRWGAAVQ